MDVEDQIITVRKFYDSVTAEIYAAKLRDEGVSFHLRDGNIANILHLATQSIRLEIHAKDREWVERILSELDQLHRSEPDEDFREADQEEIQYQKKLHEEKTAVWPKKNIQWLFLIVLVLILLLGFALKYLNNMNNG